MSIRCHRDISETRRASSTGVNCDNSEQFATDETRLIKQLDVLSCYWPPSDVACEQVTYNEG